MAPVKIMHLGTFNLKYSKVLFFQRQCFPPVKSSNILPFFGVRNSKNKNK